MCGKAAGTSISRRLRTTSFPSLAVATKHIKEGRGSPQSRIATPLIKGCANGPTRWRDRSDFDPLDWSDRHARFCSASVKHPLHAECSTRGSAEYHEGRLIDEKKLQRGPAGGGPYWPVRLSESTAMFAVQPYDVDAMERSPIFRRFPREPGCWRNTVGGRVSSSLAAGL